MNEQHERNQKLIDIPLTSNEQYLQPLIDEFNRLCTEEGKYPALLSWGHYTLFVNSNYGSPQEWKNFRLNPKIQQWYSEEQDLQMRSSLMKLSSEINDGNGKSTGQAQTITALLNQINRNDTKNNGMKIIYNFIPLTEFEEKNPNVTILQHIPPEIRNAIQVIGAARTNEKQNNTNVPIIPDTNQTKLQ